MSNKKHSDSLITDEKTLMRRAWVDLALDSVRSQLNFKSHESADMLAAGYDAADVPAAADAHLRSERHLYLAYSAAKAKAS